MKKNTKILILCLIILVIAIGIVIILIKNHGDSQQKSPETASEEPLFSDEDVFYDDTPIILPSPDTTGEDSAIDQEIIEDLISDMPTDQIGDNFLPEDFFD